jgi:Y-X(10)_GDL-associated radical SAM protein
MDSLAEVPARFRSAGDVECRIPIHVVWELTLACDLKCIHCGSRAGHRRISELNTRECLQIVDSFARLGTREVSLIGGEAYLRRDLPEIIQGIRSHGIYCGIQTGGRNFTAALMERAVRAGLNGLGVSLDGLEPLHDRLRGFPGSFRAAVDTLRRAKNAGLRTSVNTQIGADVVSDLPSLLQEIIETGARQWQVQLTVPIGNAADREDILLQPYRLVELMPILARLYHKAQDHGVLLIAGNNIGYFGPYEHLWRGYADDAEHWTGCSAGVNVLALESDGTVKGCPSLPTAAYAAGNARDLSLESIWRASLSPTGFMQKRSVAELWGFCRSCYYADVCLGGCTWMAHSLLGRPGNNPYCHYRALELAKRGLRERIVKTHSAPSLPFATGAFKLVVERLSAGEAIGTSSPPAKELSPIPRAGDLDTSVPLDLCRACDNYIRSDETICPHCGAPVLQTKLQYAEDARRRRMLINQIRSAVAISQKESGRGVDQPEI